MGVPQAERLAFVGLFSALIFVVGMPLVPLWGVWADKYSRKAVIVRSCLVEAVVFAGVALSREPWQLALSMLLIGFQLGNTGVMLAGIRDVTPLRRLGMTIARLRGVGAGRVRGRAGARGRAHRRPRLVVRRRLLVLVRAVDRDRAARVVRVEGGPPGGRPDRPAPRARLRGGAQGALSDPAVRRIFLIFGFAYLGTQMTPAVHPGPRRGLVGPGPGLASAIGLVMGTAALVGALVSPLGGVLGDRVGFRPVLVAALGGAGSACC